jgi:hypothetical protein
VNKVVLMVILDVLLALSMVVFSITVISLVAGIRFEMLMPIHKSLGVLLVILMFIHLLLHLKVLVSMAKSSLRK